MTMKAVKQFSPGFYEGSRWIKDNTPPDAIVLSLWTHQTVYTTERNAFWMTDDLVGILTFNNQTTVDLLKKNGFDYVFVQKWSITEGAYYQGYPSSFITFLNGDSKNFNKTFENAEEITYKVN